MIFLQFLKDNHVPTDNPLRKFNVERELKSDIKLIQNDSYITVSSVIAFVCGHRRQFNICQKISDQIEKKLVISSKQSSNQEDCSLQELYAAIVKSGILLSSLYIPEHSSDIKIDEGCYPSIGEIYKPEFTETEWKKICIFEKHFTEAYSVDISNESYEGLLKKKREYFKTDISKLVQINSKQVINRRLKRKSLGDTHSGITINARSVHIPDVLESELLDLLYSESGVNEVICVDCTKACRHQPSVHVYVEINNEKLVEINDLITLITTYLNRKHKVNCAEISFYKIGTTHFDVENEGKGRFQMRDEHLSGKLSKHRLFNWVNSDAEEEETEWESCDVKCQECFGDPYSLLKPLSIYSFNLIQEWYIDTPLMCQVLFEPFINQQALKYTENKQNFMRTKLTKLYGIYDALLNVSNKNYSGLIQDINTQELSMNFKSINSVFEVTSAAGATQSLNMAENKIKKKATTELCYYNTYLKRIPLTYETMAGMETKHVSLRECAIILMIDNLVRLKYHSDPDPGESRSMQICTLPVTLKGLPLDSAFIDGWHEKDCNGMSTCNCMEDKQLRKGCIDTILLTLSEAEISAMDRFQK